MARQSTGFPQLARRQMYERSVLETNVAVSSMSSGNCKRIVLPANARVCAACRLILTSSTTAVWTIPPEAAPGIPAPQDRAGPHAYVSSSVRCIRTTPYFQHGCRTLARWQIRSSEAPWRRQLTTTPKDWIGSKLSMHQYVEPH
jgi:hypothetical protein